MILESLPFVGVWHAKPFGDLEGFSFDALQDLNSIGLVYFHIRRKN